LKKRIRENVGDFLTCSVGIASSVFLAKMASECKKPDGLTILKLADLVRFYADLNLRDLTGISWRLEERLNKFGILTPADLFDCSLDRLAKVLDHWGKLWYFRLRGFDVDNFKTDTKTIGHSHVLEPEFRTKEGAMIVLKKLLLKTGYRLRKEKFFAAGISLSINFFDRGNFHLSKKVMPFCDSKSLNSHFMAVLKDCSWKSRPILISVAVFNLIKGGGEQISIFADIEKSKNLSKAMDEINDDFGAGTVMPASIVGGEATAPDRISFGKPRYEIIN
jgi:DNA polymerase-4